MIEFNEEERYLSYFFNCSTKEKMLSDMDRYEIYTDDKEFSDLFERLKKKIISIPDDEFKDYRKKVFCRPEDMPWL